MTSFAKLLGASLAFALFLPGNGLAQSTRSRGAPVRVAPPAGKVTTSHSFGLLPEVSFFQVKDEALARLRHQGFVPGVNLRYDYRSREWLHGGQIGFRYGGLSSRYDTPADAGRLGWNYGGSYSLYRDADWNVFAGAQLRGTYDVHLYPLVDESHGYWLTAYDVRATGRAQYSWTRRSHFEAELAFPLFGIIGRPPYPRYYNNDKPDAGWVIGRIHEDLAFATLPSYISTELKLSYRYIVTTQVAQSVSYQFEYSRFDDPRPIQMLTHSLLLGLHVDPWGGF